MTKEDKLSLIKDLSMRIPYGVYCEIKYGTSPLMLVGVMSDDNGDYYTKFGLLEVKVDVYEPKPYLRRINLEDKLEEELEWYLKNHFDINGLIDKGLAIEAPYGMYEEG